MTYKECAVVMAYTGICMLAEDKFWYFHKYVEDILGRPVYLHELADNKIATEIKEKSKADFMELCRDARPGNTRFDRVTASPEALAEFMTEKNLEKTCTIFTEGWCKEQADTRDCNKCFLEWLSKED